LGEETADLANVVTATALLKLAKQSGNVAPPGEYDRMVRWVPIRHMISTQKFMEIWSANSLWLVHCCRTTEKWAIPRVWGVILRYYSAYPHQIWWAYREMIGN